MPQPQSGQHVAPLAFAQEQIWFLDQLEPGSPRYNISVGYRLHGHLHVAALECALQHIVPRHEPLRTHYRFDGERPFQVVSPEHTFVLQKQTASFTSEAEPERTVRSWCEQRAVAAFDS